MYARVEKLRENKNTTVTKTKANKKQDVQCERELLGDNDRNARIRVCGNRGPQPAVQRVTFNSVQGELIAAHTDMAENILKKYGSKALYIGVGGSPELLIDILGSYTDVAPISIPVTGLQNEDGIRDDLDARYEGDELETAVKNRVEDVTRYFKEFIRDSAKGVSEIVVLDYVSTGSSLKAAVDYVRLATRDVDVKVIGQPIACKERVSDLPQPLIVDKRQTELFNQQDVKKLTRTSPRVQVSSTEVMNGKTTLEEAFKDACKAMDKQELRNRRRNKNKVIIGVCNELQLRGRKAKARL